MRILIFFLIFFFGINSLNGQSSLSLISEIGLENPYLYEYELNLDEDYLIRQQRFLFARTRFVKFGAEFNISSKANSKFSPIFAAKFGYQSQFISNMNYNPLSGEVSTNLKTRILFFEPEIGLKFRLSSKFDIGGSFFGFIPLYKTLGDDEFKQTKLSKELGSLYYPANVYLGAFVRYNFNRFFLSLKFEECVGKNSVLWYRDTFAYLQYGPRHHLQRWILQFGFPLN